MDNQRHRFPELDLKGKVHGLQGIPVQGGNIIVQSLHAMRVTTTAVQGSANG